MSKTYSAGIVTAYGAAKRAGYQGTYEDFCRQQAGYAGNAAAVETAKNTAVSAANTATTKAMEATTAATAAQTAKTQTEAAASQALTDISTAESGAISAVQTEGATQTANARAQAQAATQSATTARTKASEASASATSAGQSATNAAASATNAASSASAAQGVLESIPSDYSQMSADVSQLQADLGDLSEFVHKEITKEHDSAISVISNTSIESNRHIFDVNIPQGTKYTFIINSNGLINKYTLYANGAQVKTNLHENIMYELTASTDITYLSIYVLKTDAAATGTANAVLTVTETTNDSIEERVETIEETIESNEVLKRTIVDADIKTQLQLVEIGATHNNDSGNTTYIYHGLPHFDVTTKDVVGIKIGDIIDNVNDPCVYVRAYDSENTKVLDVPVTRKKAMRGYIVRLPSDAVKAKVILYPSTSGGLTTEYAKYIDILVYTSCDGRLRINTDSAPDKYAVPAYYFVDDYLPNKVSAIRSIMENANGNYDAFIFCTDQHWTLNAKQSPKLIHYLADQLNIPRLFTGGDYADGINMEAYLSFRKCFDGKLYNTVGNHEYMDNIYDANNNAIRTPLTPVTDATIWINLNGGMTDAVIGNSGRNYYYVDNPMQKMRYIILNDFADGPAFSFETEQKEWLDSVLSDMPTGYYAVIFIHAISSVNRTTGELVQNYAYSNVQSVVDNYVNRIVAIFAGHTHFDGLGATTGGVPIFITTCDKYMPLVGDDDYLEGKRTVNTITEQAFDVVVIDKTHQTITAVRIGCPADNPTGLPLESRSANYGS